MARDAGAVAAPPGAGAEAHEADLRVLELTADDAERRLLRARLDRS